MAQNPSQNIFSKISDPNNRTKIIGVVLLVALIGFVGFAKYKNKQKQNDEYKEQNLVHPDDFFNTTPKPDNEKIVVIFKDNKVIKLNREFDRKGNLIAQDIIETMSEGKVKRGNEYLQDGEQLKNGDIAQERVVVDENNKPIKEIFVFQDNELVSVMRPVDENGNVQYSDANTSLEGLKEMSSYEEIINGKSYRVAKFIDKSGNVIGKVFDANNNQVPDETILSDQTVVDNSTKKLTRVTKKVLAGRIIKQESDLRGLEQGDEIALKNDGLFHFTRNSSKGLSSEDELRISNLQYRRAMGRGEFKILKTKEELDKIAALEALETRTYTVSNKDNDYSEHKEPRTTTSYPVDLARVITIDKIIPAVLITEINSDIPSKTVKAQIEQDIYGSHGRKILIPKGSKAIGEYQKLEDRAARRMEVVWYRIITPSGINIKLEGQISDAVGASGSTGEVDRRLQDRYGMAFMLSVMNAATQLSVPVDDLRYRAAADSFTREFGSVTGQLIREGLKVMPTITIPQGARINISPLQDIWFKEPQNNQINVVPYENTNTNQPT